MHGRSASRVMLLDGAPGGSGLGPRRWVILGVCVLGFMQSYVHRFGFAPLIPGFIADLGLTYAAAGTIMSAYFWTYGAAQVPVGVLDRKSTRLNSSHGSISYAVFCLKKKNKIATYQTLCKQKNNAAP